MIAFISADGLAFRAVDCLGAPITEERMTTEFPER